MFRCRKDLNLSVQIKSIILKVDKIFKLDNIETEIFFKVYMVNFNLKIVKTKIFFVFKKIV